MNKRPRVEQIYDTGTSRIVGGVIDISDLRRISRALSYYLDHLEAAAYEFDINVADGWDGRELQELCRVIRHIISHAEASTNIMY